MLSELGETGGPDASTSEPPEPHHSSRGAGTLAVKPGCSRSAAASASDPCGATAGASDATNMARLV
jgi:hypothetical protein